MTRAMEHLHISHAMERRRFGERSFRSPSRFLDEIPSELTEILKRARGRRSSSSARSGSDSSFDYSYSQESPEGEVQVGMRVRHSVFGQGEIMEVLGTGLSQKLKIRFKRVGMKTVLVRFANLELI